MEFSAYVFGILLASCCASELRCRDVDEGVLLWHSEGRRVKRAGIPVYNTLSRAAKLGEKAKSKLLDGAKHLSSESKYFRYYKKRGGISKAERDFAAVAPERVSNFGVGGVPGKVGHVGDRFIIFKTRGWSGNPTIEIVKEKKLQHMIIPSGNPSHVSDVIDYVE